jgi:hypothetical protein
MMRTRAAIDSLMAARVLFVQMNSTAPRCFAYYYGYFT